MTDFLEIHRGTAPLIVSMPHTGIEIPKSIESRLVSPWLARKDADWWIEKLYDFAPSLGATTIRTTISRTVIDVNRDPSGQSLYPSQTTTGLCPTETFDGEALYRGAPPDNEEIAARRKRYFDPYHSALQVEIARLKARHESVVLYEAHSIRSRVPRLFDGELPQFNIGTNSGQSCAYRLTTNMEDICKESGFSHVADGRFKGGWTTRHYGQPGAGIHAIQMELACRGYMDEPLQPNELNWPTPYAETRAAKLRLILVNIFRAGIDFAGA
jgi:formiminoglutamase